MERNAALRRLSGILVRIWKGELGERIYYWSVAVREARRSALTSSLTDLEREKLRALEKERGMQKALLLGTMNLKNAAMRMLRNTMLHVMKGELGFRVHLWKEESRSYEALLERERLRRQAASMTDSASTSRDVQAVESKKEM